jgi:hypothetical protein
MHKCVFTDPIKRIRTRDFWELVLRFHEQLMLIGY